MSARIITTEPTVEPVSLAEAKLYLRVTEDDQNDVITALIEAARKKCEQLCNRSFIDTTWTRYYDRFPDVFLLTPVPLDSVTSISYLDVDGASQTLTAVTDYRVDVASEPARVEKAHGTSWPNTYDVVNAVTVVYKVGYGAAGTDVPEGIRTAIKMLCATWYEFRESIISGVNVAKVPWHVEAILDTFKHTQFAGSLP